MPDFTISRTFDYTRTELPDGTHVDDVWYAGKAPLNGGGAPGVRLGRCIGRVHHRVSGEWFATPESSPPWDDLLWYGPFRTRAEASMHLVGMWTPLPRYCPSCGTPVMTGDGPLRALFNRRDGERHVCP